MLGGRSDELLVHRPKELGIPLAASIAGATAPKKFVGKPTDPPAEWASGPSSSSAGPEAPAEPAEPGDQPRMSPAEIPLAESEPEIETWRPLTSAEQESWESVILRQRIVQCIGAPT